MKANPGRLLTKDELIEIVWEGTAAGDTLSNVSITELRRILGDDAKVPRYVQTVHGRGFRFIAALQRPDPSSPDGAKPSSLLVLGRDPNEKITWGKLGVETPKYVIESDATIVAPLIFAYVLGQ